MPYGLYLQSLSFHIQVFSLIFHSSVYPSFHRRCTIWCFCLIMFFYWQAEFTSYVYIWDHIGYNSGRRGQSQVTYFSYKLLSLGSSLSKYWRIYPVVLLRMCQLSMVYIWWIMSHSMWWDAAQNLKSKRNSVSKHFLWSPLDILQGRTKIYDSVSHYWPDILQHLSFKLYDVFIVVTAFHQIESVILLFVVLCILWLIFPSSLSEFWILSISQYPNGELGYKTI